MTDQDSEYLVFRKRHCRDHHYNRSSSEEGDKLIELLKTAYDCMDCVLTTSGMNAISSILIPLFDIFASKPEQLNIVYGDQLYSDTPDQIMFLTKSRPNIKLFTINITDSKSICELFDGTLKNQNNILLIETCSNPGGQIMDYSILKFLEDASSKFISIFDNTWLSHVIFNPFDLPDYTPTFVICSLTKYYSGGRCIAGCILSKTMMYFAEVEDWISQTGIHVSPHSAQLIADRMLTMEDRIKISSSKTIHLIELFKDKLDILHPYVQNNIFKNDLYPSVFAFVIKNKCLADVINMMKSSKYIPHKTSYGAECSKTDTEPRETKDGIICRLAVGYGDESVDPIDNIVKGLNEFVEYYFL